MKPRADAPPRKLSPRRMGELVTDLPYGIWRCADGREVLFNRNYQPLWQRHRGQITLADPTEWVSGIVTQVHFYRYLEDADEALIARLSDIVQAFCVWRSIDCLDRGAA